jgi:hypothetical protein
MHIPAKFEGTIFIVEHVPNLESEPSCTVQGLYLAVSINTAKDILCALFVLCISDQQTKA